MKGKKISFSSSAITNGTSRRRTILLMEITSVLRTTVQNVGIISMSLKFCSPTQSV